MSGGGPTFSKRQRERQRDRKKQEKAERRARRRAERGAQTDTSSGGDPDIDHIVPGPQPVPWEMDDLDV